MAKKPTYRELEQRAKELEKEALKPKQAEDKEKQYIRELEFLSKTATEFVELSLEENIYQFIGKKLTELIGESIVIVNSFSGKSDGSCTRAIMGLGKRTEAIIRILGADPVGKTFKVEDEGIRALTSGKLHKIPGGIYRLTPDIPKAAFRAIEKLLALGDAYSMGFTWEGKLFGNAIILLRQGCELQNENIIETFMRQASVALQRKEAEEALRKAHDELEMRVDERTAELVKTNERLKREIEERKRAEEALREREAELETKTNSLEEVNTALRVLLKRRDEDKRELEEKVLVNVKELVVPFLEKVKNSQLDSRQVAYMDILESNLNDITSPFLRNLSAKYVSLTPTEIRVAHLINEGKTTKEVGEVMALSPRTIETHRRNMRKKFGIEKKRGNLRSHLSALQ